MNNSTGNNGYINFLNNKISQCWTDDNTVDKCYHCNAYFSYILRKHHCRLCGKIFCYTCSNYHTGIPENLLSSDSKKGTWGSYISTYIVRDNKGKYRTCKKCHDFINRIENVQQLIEVFRLAKFDLYQLKILAKVCKLWNNAANYLISIFKDIQYKVAEKNDHTDYNEIEKFMLNNNAKYIVGHNRYMVHLLKICRTDKDYERITTILKGKKNVNCGSLLCSVNCRDILTYGDAITLLKYSFSSLGRNDYLRSIAINHLQCSDDIIGCYLPILVYYIRYDDGFLTDYLIKRCSKNIKLLNNLYWELHMYPKDEYHVDVYSNVLKKLSNLMSGKGNEHNHITILKAHSLIAVFDTISRNICDDGKKYDDIKNKFSLKKDVVSPLNPEIAINNILIDKIKIKHSATKPIMISCGCVNGDITTFLYKKENLRKDQLVSNIIKLADRILKEEESLDLDIVTYDVLPTSKNEGIIEVVDNSETLYYIQERINTTILNYILENNDNLKIKDIRQKFIKSTAFYSVLSYLLGIGDRHLDNIMVTRDGKLFHIDYGYILGNDPVFNNPGIRITKEIIEAIGGFSSNNYIQFTELCTQIYNCLRRNMDMFINILLLLPKISDINLTEERIREILIRRFLPGENNIDAKLHLVKQLENRPYTDAIKDWCHYHSKEQTINSAVSRFTNAISSLWYPVENHKPLNDDMIKDKD